MAKKESLGFKTPNLRIQEDYKEILEQIEKKKADWERLTTKTLERAYGRCKDADSSLKELESKKPGEVTHDDLLVVALMTMQAGQYLGDSLIAKIGMELAECDVRIAAIEKELKDLRKGL